MSGVYLIQKEPSVLVLTFFCFQWNLWFYINKGKIPGKGTTEEKKKGLKSKQPKSADRTLVLVLRSDLWI
jgi:hypothetical protein